jgi:hypothetical protein
MERKALAGKAVRTIVILALVLLLLELAGDACRPVMGSDSEEKTIAQRLADRTFPSLFQAWDPIDNLPAEDDYALIARHDLYWHVPLEHGLIWDRYPDFGLSTKLTTESIEAGLERRRALLALNPNLIILAAIFYRDAPDDFLPPDHGWWLRDEDGNRIIGWQSPSGDYIAYLLDFGNRKFRKQVALRSRAIVRSGVVDGVFLDWWDDEPGRVKLVKAIRKAIGKDALIVGNVNMRKIPKTAPYVNGVFMECYEAQTREEWLVIESTLLWAQQNLREPRITCLNTWYQNAGSEESVMRAITTLSLTRSDGYSLFSNYKQLHCHDWYPFLAKSLGKATGEGRELEGGAWIREFENGTAVYNRPGNKAVTIKFKKKHRSMATGRKSRRHTVKPFDGDIFIEVGK